VTLQPLTGAPLDVCIVRTGLANVASVGAALRRLGARPFLSESARDVQAAPAVVLPGVGAFGAAMHELGPTGMADAVSERFRSGQPMLCICLGFQILLEASDESPGTPGLSLVPGVLRRFPATARTPQMGWNTIEPTSGAALLESAPVYFANSYRLEALPAGWQGATAHYSGPFIAALERGPILACQFHPELSGAAGMRLLSRWLARCAANAEVPC
jgi:imidazole glycerol-phosphate synthase subunit HisH